MVAWATASHSAYNQNRKQFKNSASFLLDVHSQEKLFTRTGEVNYNCLPSVVGHHLLLATIKTST